MKLKYVIISDIHLGSGVCQHDKILNLLLTLNTEVLILNGDFIDVDHLKRLSKKDWKILTLLRKLSKHTRIIYIPGNHDRLISEIISDLLGFEFIPYFNFIWNCKQINIQHGDYFDSFISSFPVLTEIATGIYYYIQLLSSKKQMLARTLKRKSKNFLKSCETTKQRAELYAKHNNIDIIICGHVHQHFISETSRYINTGCFTEIECSYLEISDSRMDLKMI